MSIRFHNVSFASLKCHIYSFHVALSFVECVHIILQFLVVLVDEQGSKANTASLLVFRSLLYLNALLWIDFNPQAHSITLGMHPF